MSKFTISVVAVVAFSFHAHCGQTVSDELLAKWVSIWSKYQSFEITWDVIHEVADRDGSIVDYFDTIDHFQFRWPETFLHQSRVVPRGDNSDSSFRMQFDRDMGVNTSGVHFVRNIAIGSEDVLAEASSLRQLVRTQAMNAPNLLALWMNEKSVSEWTLSNTENGMSSVLLSDLRMKLFLRDDVSFGPVLIRLEVLSNSGSPVIWWDFDDFIKPGQSTPAVAQTRITFSSNATGIYEGPPSTMSNWKLIEQHQEPAPSTEAIDEDNSNTLSTTRSIRRGSLGFSMLIGTGLILLCIGVGIFMWKRRYAH
jgi:hypothetical protein